MAKAKLSDFVKALPRFPKKVRADFLNSWNKNTLFTLAEANKKVPVASGELQRSGVALKAEITPKGIVSYIEYKQPYASKLNDVNSGLKLKDAGQLSYTVKGTRVNKRQKGELGYLSKAIKQEADNFMKDINKIIDKEWRSLPG
jgi:hypothetical protein